MQKNRLGLLISGLLVAVSACVIAPLEGDGDDTVSESSTSSWELQPGKEKASLPENGSGASRPDRARPEVRLERLRSSTLVTGPTPDPWEEAMPSAAESSGPTPDPWQPAQPDGNERKGSSPEGSSANGTSKN